MFSVLDLLPPEPLAAPASFLDTLAGDLYRRAANRPVARPVAVRVVDDWQVAREVLVRHDGFRRNYDFLWEFARGRLSSEGGTDWAQRAALTRSWFRPGSAGPGRDAVSDIYGRRIDAALPAGADALFDTFVQAGVEVFSSLVGLSRPLAWSSTLGARIREQASLRQTAGWTGSTTDALARSRQSFVRLREEVDALWQAQPESAAFLAALARDGREIAGFSAAEELIVAVMASSETTATVLMWCADCLAGRPALAERIAADGAARASFVAEVLRLFPPVPLLTRRSSVAQEASGEMFEAGEMVGVSIVGMHCDPRHWPSPMTFDPARAVFAEGATPPAYLPFSRGERGCAGIKVAHLEIDAGLVQLLRRATLLRGPTRSSLNYGLSLRPATTMVAARRGAFRIARDGAA